MKPFTFRGCFAAFLSDPTTFLQNSIGGGGADGHNISIEHHEGEPAVALQRILVVKVDDRLLFPGLQPEITENVAVVLVLFPVAFLPGGVFTRRDAQPEKKDPGSDAYDCRPFGDEVDHFVTLIMGNPAAL